jgi:short-subunit dehydrogenase
MTFLCREFGERLVNRGQRSAIINLSSNIGITASQTVVVYSAGKAYDLRLSLSLSESLKENVDVLAVCPGFIITPMTKRLHDLVPLGVTPGEVVEASLRQLGRDYWTFGAITHKIANVSAFLPVWLMQGLTRSMFAELKTKINYK